MNEQNKNIAFDANVEQKVELSFDQPKAILSNYPNKDGSDKYNYLYGIKKTINGESAFFATAYLNDIIQQNGAKEGTKLSITKVEKTVDGEKRTKWEVKVIGGETKDVSIDDVPKVIHEVNTEKTLEEKVDILWKAYSKTDPSNPVDDLPF